MILIPKKLRPPQMWWVIEQQARRRRAAPEEPSAPATAEWFPHEAVVGWSTSEGFVTGDWDAFSAVDPATVLTLELDYSGGLITGVTGLENLTALQALSLTYGSVSFPSTALPAILETLSMYYNYITSLPDLTNTPNLTFVFPIKMPGKGRKRSAVLHLICLHALCKFFGSSTDWVVAF